MFAASRHGMRAVVAAALVAAALAAATPAEAVVINSLQCESGNRRFRCDLNVSTVGTLTIDWYVNGSQVPGFHNRRSVLGLCTKGAYVGVEVRVTEVYRDEETTVTRTSGVTCTDRPWP